MLIKARIVTIAGAERVGVFVRITINFGLFFGKMETAEFQCDGPDALPLKTDERVPRNSLC